MKFPFISLALFTAFILSATTGIAQNCSKYYPMKKGTVYELTKYDKKNKVAGTTKNEITDFKTEGSNQVATIHNVVTDEDGKETVNAEFRIICDGKGVTLDMMEVIKEKVASSASGTEVDADITGTNPYIPNNLTVGTNLPDSHVDMDFSAGEVKMSFGAKTFNKKVVGTETITVPAGTYDCVVLTEDNDTQMLISKHTNSKLWIAEGVGVVKHETYDKKGKLTETEVLTSFRN